MTTKKDDSIKKLGYAWARDLLEECVKTGTDKQKHNQVKMLYHAAVCLIAHWTVNQMIQNGKSFSDTLMSAKEDIEELMYEMQNNMEFTPYSKETKEKKNERTNERSSKKTKYRSSRIR